MYHTHVDDSVLQDYLDAACRHDAILLINIQPGRADFIDEVEYWEDFLVEPDVGVALDPECVVEEGQTPGWVYGRTSGAELNESARHTWLIWSMSMACRSHDGRGSPRPTAAAAIRPVRVVTR